MSDFYVIKTRCDTVEQFLYYNRRTGIFEFNELLHNAFHFGSLDEARDHLYVECLIGNKFMCDIYKVVKSIEYVERGL